ncbi:hypothetical protein [Actinomycetospora termitidis]|uniref:Glycosyltransferase RgtA/B/C/D-like domain-containing protein n=1 Tax=Actinomycetospora termitidis TaxID=3053470 RepID=A0ABT7MFV1_9PSEU|nr:hypothetical protein [Actinomycetospora sp. Odt1-22]MDL5159549.1 hypothetical protein [Actinomycetospora sp. Odt1-22]
MSTLEVTPPPAVCHVEPARHVPWWVEALGLLLAPGIVAALLRLTPMSMGLQTRWTMVDPNFSTAYARHGADLIERFGTGDYFWVRVGQVLPAHLAQLAFGDVGGFVVLRYAFALIATVPAYLWLRRRSLPTGALAVVVILTSPVVLMAWGSDYPDGAALAYLLAGLPLLVFWTTGVRRLLVRGLAGVFLGLAVHAHPAAFPLVAAALVAVLVSAFSRHAGVRRARTRRVVVELAAVVLGGVAATGLAVLGALLLYGRADLFGPTIDQLLRLQRPDQIRQWHSTTWAWAQRATYLLVPPVVVIAWAWLCRRRRRLVGEWPPRGDAVVVLGSGLGYLAFLAIQATSGFTLEYYFYSSLLWAGACLTTALLLSTLSSSWWPVAAVLGLAVLQVEMGTPRFEVVPTGLAVAVVVVVAAAVVGGPRRRSIPMLVVTVGLVLLTTGQPSTAYAPDQVRYPLADYGSVGGHPDPSKAAAYATMVSVVDVVPPAPVRALTWVEPPAAGSLPDEVPARAAAQYLGPLHGLSSSMPALSDSDRKKLDAAPAGSQVILLGSRGATFEAARTTLAPWAPTVERDAVLGGGTLHVEVLRLGR